MPGRIQDSVFSFEGNVAREEHLRDRFTYYVEAARAVNPGLAEEEALAHAVIATMTHTVIDTIVHNAGVLGNARVEGN
jgi:hypothetical protein